MREDHGPFKDVLLPPDPFIDTLKAVLIGVRVIKLTSLLVAVCEANINVSKIGFQDADLELLAYLDEALADLTKRANEKIALLYDDDDLFTEAIRIGG